MNNFRSSLPGGKEPRAKNPVVPVKRSRGAKADEVGSVAMPRAEARTADHRDGDRHRLSSETVQVQHGGVDHQAVLINLSGGGAMVASDFMPRLWDRVDLSLGEGLPLECAVRWIRGDRLGLEFAHETMIGADRATRDAVLLETIRRSFPEVTAAPAFGKAPAKPAADDKIPEGGSRRAERRHPLIWSGKILFDHDEHAARLRNISASGALVECAASLPEAGEVLLDLGHGVQHFARVSWSRSEQNGLIFETPFDLVRLAEARPEVAPQRWTRPGFLDLAPAQDSPWAEQWERQTLDQLHASLEGYLKH